MGKSLKGKTAFIVAILVVFCYGFMGVPHGVSPTALKQALADRIKLGLDLKGGTHLVLKVHVEEAVGSATDRDVQRLEEDLAKAGITGASVHKLDPVAHPDRSPSAACPLNKASDARTDLTGTDYANYDVATTPTAASADHEAERHPRPGSDHPDPHHRDHYRARERAGRGRNHGPAVWAGRQRDPGRTARHLRSGQGGGCHQVHLQAGRLCGGQRSLRQRSGGA